MARAFSFQQRLRIYMRDAFTCRYCGRALNPLSPELSLDHVDPEGSDNDDNLATACKNCNSSKNRRTVEQWRGGERRAPKLAVSEKMEAGPSPRAILTLIALEADTTIELLTSVSRAANLVEARRRAAYYFRNELGFSYSMIARLLGRDDHSTIVHLLKKDPVKTFSIISGETLSKSR